MTTTDEPKSQIIFLDDNGNPTTKEKATACRIIEFDADGERVFETYGVITPEPKPKQEVDK